MARKRKKQDWTLFEKIDLFRKDAEKIRNTKLLKNKGLKANFNIVRGSVHVWEILLEELDEEEFRSFVLNFRNFIRENSPYNLSRIYNILTSPDGLRDEKLKNDVIKAKDSWKADQNLISIKLKLNGEHITPKEITKLYINANYFHPEDKEKREKLDSLDSFHEKLFRHNFYNYIVRAANHVAYLDSIMNKAIRENLLVDDSLS